MHSFLSPGEFERRWYENENFRIKFLEERNRKEERRMKNRIEKKRRLIENVSLEDGISIQNQMAQIKYDGLKLSCPP